MVFWVVTIGLAAAGLAPVLAAMLRPPRGDAGAPDLAIYRDQLAEVERDVVRGTLNEDEAERLRLEVQRRLLAADRGTREAIRPAGRGPVRALAAIVVVAGVAGAAALYAVTGAPGYPDRPIATRLAEADARRARRPNQAEAEAAAASALPAPATPDPQYAALMERLRATIADRPDDVQGLQLLARNEAAMGNFAAARRAQDHVVELQGDAAGAADWSAAGEYRTLAAGGLVTPEAEAAFDRALALDERDGRARYFKGLAWAQVGRPDRTLAWWRPLLEESTDAAPWVAPIRAQIAGVAALAGIRYDPPPARGPSAEDLQAAEEMSPEDRAAMIEGMVANLSDRLGREGGPAQDWARLIAAYGVLGDRAQAAAIADEARGVFAAAPADLALIEEAAARAAGATPEGAQ